MELAVKNKTWNKPGITMFFVLMFMIIASLLGSSLMFLSTKQSEIGGDYYAKRTAEDAAESALDWFEGAIEDYTFDNTENMQSVLDWIENFDNNSNENRWFNGTTNGEQTVFAGNDISSNFEKSTEEDATYIKINGERVKAKIRIENVDPYNNVVTIKAIGYGTDDSRKTIRAIYKLSGAVTNELIDYDTIVNPKDVLTHAYYTDSRVTTNGNETFEVIGNSAYIGGFAEFKGPLNVDGNFRLMNGVKFNNASGNINGNIYIKGNCDIESNGITFGKEGQADYCFIDGALDCKSRKFYINTTAYIGFLQNMQNGFVNASASLYVDKTNDFSNDGTAGINVNENLYINTLNGDNSGIAQKKLEEDHIKDLYESKYFIDGVFQIDPEDLWQSNDKKGLSSNDFYNKYYAGTEKTSGITWGEGFPNSEDIVKDETGEDYTQESEEIDVNVAELTKKSAFSISDISEDLTKQNIWNMANNFSLQANNINDLYNKGYTMLLDHNTRNNAEKKYYRYPSESGSTIQGWSKDPSAKFKETNGVMVVNFNQYFNNCGEKFGGGEIAPGVKVALAVNNQYSFNGGDFWSAPDKSSALGIFCNPVGDDDGIVGKFDEFQSTGVINGMFYSSVGDISSRQYTNNFTGAVIIKGENINYQIHKDLEVEYNDDVVRLFAGISDDGQESIFLEPGGDGESLKIPQSIIDTTKTIVTELATTVIKPKLISEY